MRKFKFDNIRNGSISEGYYQLIIRDHIAEVPDAISAALGGLIDTYGGVEVFEAEPEAEKPKKKGGSK